MLDEKVLPERVAPMRDQLRIQERRIKGAGAKDMILMDAPADLTFPYPPSSKLIPVASLSEEDVANTEKVVRDPVFFDSDCLNFAKIKISPQNICDPEIWQLNWVLDQTVLTDGN